jgi:hypothetical protein
MQYRNNGSSVVLDYKRSRYGKRILATLSQQLSWSHFKEILPLKSEEARGTAGTGLVSHQL